MRRRDLFLTATSAAVFASQALGATSGARRVRPGDPLWPSPSAWELLNSQVGGRLSRPTKLLEACDSAPKSAECATLFKALQNPFFISDQASGTQVSGYLDAWTPATSAYVVAARSAADVSAAVRFARTHNLRLVVKGGGHSYLGGSNAPDSLLVWTHALRDIEVHDAFIPEGCFGLAPTPAVSLGAGCRWIEAYDAVTTQGGRYVQGGGCTTVGVAGLVQGGGFGSFSKRYGLAAAGLLEAEIVTADGEVRIANPRRNPDLFWALKGGGGGSFGVVTRLTLATHAAPERGGGFSMVVKANSVTAFRKLVGAFVDFYAERLCNPHWGEQVSIRRDNTLKVGMVTQDLEDAAALETWRPFLAAIEGSDGEWTLTSKPDVGSAGFRHWWDVEARRARRSESMRYDERPGAPPIQGWWSDDSEQVGAFLHGYDSVWLPESLLGGDKRGLLADTLFAASRRFDVGLHFNKGLAGAPNEVRAAARNAATNPDVADAFALAIVATGGPPKYYETIGFRTDLDRVRHNAGEIRAAMAILRTAAPGAGSYISEADYFNADWRAAFWGRNYRRLREVKARYDPKGLFFVHHGVGSEDWSADGFTPLA